MISVDFLKKLGKTYSMSIFLKYIILRLAILTALICTLALVFSDEPKADDYMTGMVGVFDSGKQSLSETKFLNVGHRDEFGFGLTYQYEVGGWIDRAKEGRKNSGYGAFQIGVEAGDSVIARVMAGPAIITSPDAYLGGPFQMTEDFFYGLKGHNGNTIGIKYKHFSSAGLEQPNQGRDLLGVEASIPF